MFRTRLLSGILLVIIALVTVISGGNILFATLLVISLIGLSELYKVADVHNTLLGGVGYVGAAVYYALLWMNRKDALTFFMIVLLTVLMAVYVFTYPKYHADQVMLVFFGVFYVAAMLSYVYQTRELTQGAFLVWLVFICSWGCDTCAYCVGVLFGKHKMAPKLSPKKSVEGAVGGVLGAALIGAAYAAAVNYFAGTGADPLSYALIGAAGGLISMVGDLAASAIKRNHDIKDYGKLIPGHGGILDRFDSVIFTAPVIYYMAVLLMK